MQNPITEPIREVRLQGNHVKWIAKGKSPSKVHGTHELIHLGQSMKGREGHSILEDKQNQERDILCHGGI